jgi:hypothetical protein
MHPNGQRVIDAMRALNEGDIESVLAAWSDKPLVHWGVDGPRGGDYRDKEGLLALARHVMDASEGTLRIEPLDVLADESHGVLLLRVTATREGTPIDMILTMAVKFDEEGKQQEVWFLSNDRKQQQLVFG